MHPRVEYANIGPYAAGIRIQRRIAKQTSTYNLRNKKWFFRYKNSCTSVCEMQILLIDTE